MKLYYWKAPNNKSNFGDDLNVWLWSKLIPDFLDEDEKVSFIGIGTLINDMLPNYTPMASKKVIFSSGVGYGKVPILDDSYKVYCVRGPISAQKLKLPSEIAVTDGAILVRKFLNQTSKKLYKYSYMPHHKLASETWKTFCGDLNIGYIDPAWSTETVLNAIGQTEVLLTEAMHGAIVADALRVPWIPMISAPSILKSKWEDWCLSMGLEYQPNYIEKLSYRHSNQKDILSPIRKVKHSLQNWLKNKSVSEQFNQVIKNTHPCLSQDSKLEELTTELEVRLELFKQDYQSGIFNI